MHVALAAVAIGLYWLLSNLAIVEKLRSGPFLTLTLFGILEFCFNNWLWKCLCQIKELRLVDFSGSYAGTLISGDNSNYQSQITITQTWEKIEVDFESGEAKSRSFSAAIINDRLKKGEVELVYNYFTPGRNDGQNRLDAHYGTALIYVRNKGQELVGEYFTEQSRNSHGKLHFTRVRPSRDQ